MNREPTETSLTKRTAHALRVAALRQARERAGEDADPALTYGCVDWFRYDVTRPPTKADVVPAAPQRGAASRVH